MAGGSVAGQPWALRQGEGRKAYFFEKKKQKTFSPMYLWHVVALGQPKPAK
jgi:hypothetical protein